MKNIPSVSPEVRETDGMFFIAVHTDSATPCIYASLTFGTFLLMDIASVCHIFITAIQATHGIEFLTKVRSIQLCSSQVLLIPIIYKPSNCACPFGMTSTMIHRSPSPASSAQIPLSRALNSQKATALAAATLRESTPWDMGMHTV